MLAVHWVNHCRGGKEPRSGTELGASGGRFLYGKFGRKYFLRSVAGWSEKTCAPGCRSWCTIRGLTAQDRYLRPCVSGEAKVWDLIDFAAWRSASQGNQAGTISSQLAVIQYFHGVDVGIELPIRWTLVKSALQGISRSYTLAAHAHGLAFLYGRMC